MSVNAPASPWWYRHRGSLIGAIYGCGFFFGYLQFGDAHAVPIALAGTRGLMASGIIWAGALGLFVALSRTGRAKRSPMPR